MTNTTILPQSPIIVSPGEGRTPDAIRLMGQEILVKVACADTGGAYAIGLLKAPPMSGPPLHVHTLEDEWFYVLKGELTVQVGDQRLTAGPGTSVFAPRNVPHTFQNFGSGMMEGLVMVTPGGLESFFVEASREPLQPAELETLMRRYGMDVLGPPLSR